MTHPHPIIESVLEEFRPVIGHDFVRYRHHAYRVFSNCLLLDADRRQWDKYAIAAVFHDLGIWTAHTFDYLAPSIAQADRYLHKTGRQNWIPEISRMIYWHHKLSRYRGPHAPSVENFRKADWIDVSLGWLSFGCEKASLRAIRRAYPNAGFHLFLVRQTLKNFLRHPFDPLPVFKR